MCHTTSHLAVDRGLPIQAAARLRIPDACQLATGDLRSNQEVRSAVARVNIRSLGRLVASSLELCLLSDQVCA